MESCLRFSVIIILVAGVCSFAFAAQHGPSASAQAAGPVTAEVSDANLPATPFIAEMTSDDVYIRSGPGTNYYYCGKLKKSDKVKVVGSKFSWWQIVPPGGAYCWISKQYIEAGTQGSTVGKVIGDGVRVYAGSDDFQPMHSTTMLIKLNNGDKVTLLGEEREGYYKISPPEGAYLWVSNQYARALSSLMTTAASQQTPGAPGAPPVALAPFPTPGDSNSPQVVSANEPPIGTPAPAPMTEDEQKSIEVRQLKVQVEAEKAKPGDQQNFVELKKSLEAIMNDKEAPRAAKEALAQLKVIERCELVREVTKTSELQEQQLGQTRQRIESAHDEQVAKFEDLSAFAVIGQFSESSLFAETPGARYYRIVDSGGKTLCYAKPTGAAVDMDLTQFIDKKVGLVGAIEANAELGDAVVQFTNIVELK